MTRAQAAMEFMTTYGWAILGVILVLGSLAYAGFMNPSKFVPASCTFSAGFGCRESQAILTGGTTATVTFYVRNMIGRSISGVAFDVRSDSDGQLTSCTPLDGTDIVSGDVAGFTCLAVRNILGYSMTDKARFFINGTYVKDGGAFEHAITGEILAELQA